MYDFRAIFCVALLLLLPIVTADKVVSTITLTSSPSSTPPSAQYTSAPALQSAVLNSTNTYRHQHDASNVVWNDTLADYAKEHVKPCKFAHSKGPYGENLAQGYPDITSSIDGWGQERKDYDYKKGDFGEDTGHFTQLVWQNTTDVGCAAKKCGDNGWLLFCEYWPRGNIMTQFTQNVHTQTNDDVNKTDTTAAGPSGSKPTGSLGSSMSADRSMSLLAFGLVICTFWL